MIIDVVLNIFDKIEALLGLPREFRLGKRDDGHSGLFRREGFLNIAEEMLRRELDDGGLPVDGKGGVKALRRNLSRTRQVLRALIDP